MWNTVSRNSLSEAMHLGWNIKAVSLGQSDLEAPGKNDTDVSFILMSFQTAKFLTA